MAGVNISLKPGPYNGYYIILFSVSLMMFDRVPPFFGLRDSGPWPRPFIPHLATVLGACEMPCHGRQASVIGPHGYYGHTSVPAHLPAAPLGLGILCPIVHIFFFGVLTLQWPSTWTPGASRAYRILFPQARKDHFEWLWGAGRGRALFSVSFCMFLSPSLHPQ